MKLKLEQPLTERAREAILELIQAEGLRPGDQLPTENKLLERFGIGRSTLREALANLTHEGYLYKQQGRGTFVRSLPLLVENGIDQLYSVTENIRRVRATPSTNPVDFHLRSAGKDLAVTLQVDPETECVWLRRVRWANDLVAVYSVDVIVRSLLPESLSDEMFGESLFELLEQAGHRISHTDSHLRPKVLTQEELPELPDASGLFMLFDEVFYSVDGTPLVYGNDYYNAKLFDFRITRRRRF
ncbi:MAG: GntR family transcriptional regulator [bacterium]|jgi:GntR family transcriptional regulator